MSNEMLLLGAGASVEAGIPDAKRMAKEIIKNFNADTRFEKEAEVLNFVNEQLIADVRRRYSDPTIDVVDVEAIYNAILLLSDRETMEISPFVESWHPYLAKITDADNLFWNILFRMRKMLEELTLITDETKVDYLKPIINVARHQGRLFVATLNYDNGIELVSRANGIACDTGIEGWNRRGVFEYANDGIQLIKLHGSNYWFWTYDATTYSERLPHRLIRFKSHFDEKLPTTLLVETIMVIFGQRNKLTVEGPFLELLQQFDEQLQKTDILTIVGYSLRDPHVNFYISKFVNQYKGKIRIVDPSFETSDVEYAKYLRELRETRPDQIEIIEKYAGEALKQLYPS